MSHLRWYHAILSRDNKDADAATVKLHAATLLHKQTRRLLQSAPVFPFHDLPPQAQFQSDEIVPCLIFSEHLDWSYAFIL